MCALLDVSSKTGQALWWGQGGIFNVFWMTSLNRHDAPGTSGTAAAVRTRARSRMNLITIKYLIVFEAFILLLALISYEILDNS